MRALTVTDVNVLDAARERVRWLFEEFDGHVSVSVSGGKDSTVIMELAAEVARERGERLKVQFLDQEAEWQMTRDYLRRTADREDIDFEWYQVPFRLFNAASHEEEWGYVWPSEEPECGYMRPPEHDSIREPFKSDRFYDILKEMNTRSGGVHLTGMRAEEAPTRRLGMTNQPAYKWATWGAGKPDGSSPFYMMHPIYDWSYRDVWKAIDEHGWDYNPVYDEMHRYGVPHRNMRVSSLIHSGAVRSVEQIQEIEPKTWERLTERFAGLNTAAHIGEDTIKEARRRLPYMFDSWREYTFYLIENLVKEEHRGNFYKQFETAKRALPWMTQNRIAEKMLPSVLKNDYFNDFSFGKWLNTSRQYAMEYEKQNGHPLEPVRDENGEPIPGKDEW